MTQHHIQEDPDILHIHFSNNTDSPLGIKVFHCVDWLLCTCRFTDQKMSWDPYLTQKKGKGWKSVLKCSFHH